MTSRSEVNTFHHEVNVSSCNECCDCCKEQQILRADFALRSDTDLTLFKLYVGDRLAGFAVVQTGNSRIVVYAFHIFPEMRRLGVASFFINHSRSPSNGSIRLIFLGCCDCPYANFFRKKGFSVLKTISTEDASHTLMEQMGIELKDTCGFQR